jgi:hypothetical protein
MSKETDYSRAKNLKQQRDDTNLLLRQKQDCINIFFEKSVNHSVEKLTLNTQVAD